MDQNTSINDALETKAYAKVMLQEGKLNYPLKLSRALVKDSIAIATNLGSSAPHIIVFPVKYGASNNTLELTQINIVDCDITVKFPQEVTGKKIRVLVEINELSKRTHKFQQTLEIFTGKQTEKMQGVRLGSEYSIRMSQVDYEKKRIIVFKPLRFKLTEDVLAAGYFIDMQTMQVEPVKSFETK